MAAAVLLGVLALMALVPRAFTRADPDDCTLSRSLLPPSRAHPAGFDVFGCDHLAQTVHGARASLAVTALVVLTSALLALVVGAVAGYVGGPLDAALARVTDVWAGIPLVLGGIVLLSGTDTRGVLQVSAVLAAFSWPPMVRVLRASVRQVAALDHVTAARALGAGPWRVLTRHVLPGAVRPLLVVASASAGAVVAAEAILTFAGVGLQRPTQSWGILLFQAQDRLGQAPHLLVAPGAMLVATVLASVLLAEGLRQPGGARAGA